MPWTSRATSARSCSRLGGLVADRIVAIVSFAASIGPPGSASEIARPATNGARTIRAQSSSEKSLFVVTPHTFRAPAAPRAGSASPSVFLVAGGLSSHAAGEAWSALPARPHLLADEPGVRVEGLLRDARVRRRAAREERGLAASPPALLPPSSQGGDRSGEHHWVPPVP